MPTSDLDCPGGTVKKAKLSAFSSLYLLPGDWVQDPVAP